MTDNDNLQLAITALQTALTQVRVVRVEHPGDPLYNQAENVIAGVAMNFVSRQNQSRTPPMSPATNNFYA
ncbi:MAG TPA: hypothetical protein VKG83_11425 [Mycobacterium sp.]|nr:hypothetical protein [Mycobacterium sp.]